MIFGRTLFRFLVIVAVAWLVGCSGDASQPELVWGRRGVRNGDLVRPRAAAIDALDHLYIVDFTPRIQVFDRDGQFLGPCWTTPDYRNGRPSGLSIDRDGNLLVSDSHYNCVRVYSPEGQELRVLGKELGLDYVGDAVQDADGYYYLAEAGSLRQCVTRLDAEGRLLSRWGQAGAKPGEFARIRALCTGPDGLLYVADACNHRIQVFTRQGQLVRYWGQPGSAEGQLSYPYDLAFDNGGVLYVVEYGNHRVQKFTPEGTPLGCWGGPGHGPGQLHNPWALVVDSKGRVHVLDTENNRVQRIRF